MSTNVCMGISSSELSQKAPHLIHTSYYKNFFLLRAEIIINDQQVQVGTDEKGWLTLNSRDPKVGITFDSLVTDVNEILQLHGLHGVSNYWCEEVPLFELKGTSPYELEKLLSLQNEIWEQLALKISTHMTALLKDSKSATTGALPSLHVLVQPQLYLIIPDYPHMDGKPIQITRANFAECMALFGESRLFDFGAVFRASRANPNREDRGPEDFRTLHTELHEVVNWYHFGQALLVPEEQLLTIRQDHPNNTVMCRNAMLFWWWNNAEERNWLTLIHALANTENHRFAKKLAIKYGVPVPHRMRSQTCPASEEHSASEEVAMLRALVKKLRYDIEDREWNLAQQEQILQQVEEEKKAASRQVETLEYQITLRTTKITELMREKENMENTLRLMQFEFEVLCQSAAQQIELRQQCINLREKEIFALKMRLQMVESELEETNKLIPTLKENLQKVSVELGKKSAKVKLLQKNKNDTCQKVDTEKIFLDNYLLQQTAADISHDRYVQEVQIQRNYRKEISEMSALEYEAFHQYLEENDPEIKNLLQHILAQQREFPEATTITLQIPEHPPVIRRNTSPAHSSRPLAKPEVQAGLPDGNVQTIDSSKLLEQNKIDLGDPCPMLSSLQWEKNTVAPQAMVRGSAAVYDLTVFIIGENSNTIHSYCMNSKEWSTLPVACPHINPGLVFIDKVLTAVGGQKMGHSTNKVANLKRGKWANDIPQMKYPHSSPSVQNYNDKYIIVAGGSWNTEISMVEVYSIRKRQWFKVVHLPKSFYSITTTLCLNNYIVMDGGGATFSIDLDTLLAASSHFYRSWQEQPQIPVLGEPTLATFRKKIVCVSSDGMHQLCINKGWVKVQNTFSSFSLWSKSLVCVVGEDLAVDEKLVVVGGYDPTSEYTTTEVSVAY